MTVAAKYDGTSVADLQQLRRNARAAGVTVKVIKNRLVRTAMQQTKGFEKTDTGLLTGQLSMPIASRMKLRQLRSSTSSQKCPDHRAHCWV